MTRLPASSGEKPFFRLECLSKPEKAINTCMLRFGYSVRGSFVLKEHYRLLGP